MLSPTVLDPVLPDFSGLLPASEPDAAPAAFARVDHETLQVIDRLFPTPAGGVAFLALALRWAEVKQCACGEAFGQDVAVITVQSIRELACLIGWGYDTTHKYVALFCALGLFTKCRANGKVELRFALGRYRPPLTLDALERLIAGSRPKVQSYAKKVKRRYLLLFGTRPMAESPVPEPPISDLNEALQRIQRLIECETEPEKRKALITIMTQLERLRERLRDGQIPHPALPGRLVPETGDSRDTSSSANGRLLHIESPGVGMPAQDHGRLLPQTGDSPQPGEIANRRRDSQESPLSDSPDQKNGRLLPAAGDPAAAPCPDQGRLAQKKSPGSTGSGTPNGRLPPSMGDSAAAPHVQNGRRVPTTGDSAQTTEQGNGRRFANESPIAAGPNGETGRLFPQTGDSACESPVGTGDSSEQARPNVTVSLESFLTNHLNGNVKNVAAFLQTIFQEEPSKRGYYHHLYAQYSRPECWLAATIETLIGMHQTKTVKNAGKYFYDCCVRLHQQSALPLPNQAQVAQYAHLSYPQALAALTAPPVRAAGTTRATKQPTPEQLRGELPIVGISGRPVFVSSGVPLKIVPPPPRKPRPVYSHALRGV